MKRLFDVLFSLFLIVFLLPVFLVVSVVIIIDSGWPVFFVQQRVGQYGRLFRMFKFRTMTVDYSASKGSFDVGSSARVTRSGTILRKSKLDEIPQLFNVLMGDMSVVGPRPEVQKWVACYPNEWAAVHLLKPGITDNASLEFRNEEEILAASEDPQKTYREEILPRKLHLYQQYVKDHDFAKDISIIWKTGTSVLFK